MFFQPGGICSEIFDLKSINLQFDQNLFTDKSFKVCPLWELKGYYIGKHDMEFLKAEGGKG